ncbi:MAG: hypothetical protein V4456_16585 [Bacteroidota bacterium]
MANLDYNKRLTNLQNRRFDPGLNESAVTKLFSAYDIPEDVKYLYESMRPIDNKYNDRTIQAAENVRTHLERDFNLHFARAYRTQGSVKTKTNIRVHSDFDLLTIIDRYHYPETSNGNNYTASDPDTDIHDLRRQAIQIMRRQYDNVDDTPDKCITIENKNLKRKVDIVFAYWYNSDKYEQTRNEFYRGVYLYNFPKKQRLQDFPFATLENVNYKGDQTNDGSRKAIRLLKNLRADSDTELKFLKSFQLTSIVHAIDNQNLYYHTGYELSIATAVSNEMQKLLDDPSYRMYVKSPNGTEFPLWESDTVPEIRLLKNDLDQLITDAANDINKSHVLQRSLLAY